jgi:E3 ubiquitin-protein ligase Topors
MNETEPANKTKNEQKDVIQNIEKFVQTENTDKCPICLQKFSSQKSKSYASTCFHSFCFECLLEWSKIKCSCPLCKQEFHRIIYDLESILEYKQYILKPREYMNNAIDIIEYNPSANSVHNAITNPPSKASWIVCKESAPIQFRMLMYNNQWYTNPFQIQFDIKITNIDLDSTNSLEDTPQTSQAITVNSTSTGDVLSENLSCISFKPVNKFRNTSAKWFSKNPACAHRLIQFLDRELRALGSIMPLNERLDRYKRPAFLSKIIHLLKSKDINSDEFLNELHEQIKPLSFAKHFQHELYAYAQSTSNDLIDYDAKSVYYKDFDSIPNRNKKYSPEILPLKSLPVNIEKYRLLNFDPSLTRLRNISDNLDHSDQMIENSVTLTTPSIVIETLEDENNTNNSSNSNERAQSEFSSYCEEIEPPSKPVPLCIELSSSEQSSEDQSESKRLDSEKKPTTSSRVRVDNDGSKRSKSRENSSERRLKKHKKSSKKHIKKKKKSLSKKKKRSSRSESRERHKSRRRSRNRDSKSPRSDERSKKSRSKHRSRNKSSRKSRSGSRSRTYNESSYYERYNYNYYGDRSWTPENYDY